MEKDNESNIKRKKRLKSKTRQKTKPKISQRIKKGKKQIKIGTWSITKNR